MRDTKISKCDDFYMFCPTQCLYETTTDFSESLLHTDKSEYVNVLKNRSGPKRVNANLNDKGEKCVSSYLILGNLNIRSLLNKVDQLCLFVIEHNFDIIGINETWLDESVDDSEISIPGYSIIRKDRNRFGGGVCFYVKDTVQYCVKNDIGNGVESIWLQIKNNKKNVLISTMYRPPSAGSDYYDNIVGEIQRAKDCTNHIILMGDLNFNYDVTDTLGKNQITQIENMFNMKQLVNSPTRITVQTKSLIDVILSTDCEQHTDTSVIDISMSDHCCVTTKLRIDRNNVKQTHKHVTFSDFKQFNSDSFLCDLKKCYDIFDIQCCNDDADVNSRWEKFKIAFLEITKKHVPKKNMRLKDRFAPWISNDITKMIYKRDYLKKKSTSSKNSTLWNAYKKLRNHITSEIRNSKRRYFEEELNKHESNPKEMWKVINKITKGMQSRQTPPAELNSSIFNDYFSTIGENLINNCRGTPDNIPWKQPHCKTKFNFNEIDETEVRKHLVKLGSDSNVDVIGFDAKLLQLSCDVITPVLTKLFNLSLKTSNIPNDWKCACVTPVFKDKGDKSDVSNYRPISIISHISKVFEKLVHKQLLNYFQENNYISIDQSAFLKYHNTQTALHRCIDDWVDNISCNTLTGICSFDIKKCFDTIDHCLLLKKLHLYGIKDGELEWFNSYLSDRKQFVKCNNVISEPRVLSVGVPQGSVLGPLLFVIFINDINQHVALGTTNLFADDTLIYVCGNNVDDVNRRLQNSVTEVAKWYKSNNIVINAEKSCTMLVKPQKCIIDGSELNVYIDDCNIENVLCMKYLGLEIDETLTWNNYIAKLSKNLSFKVSKFSRLSKTLPKDILLKIYNSTIQPTIDYAISVWGQTSKTNLSKIQRLQNHSARIIEKNFDYINTRGIDLVHKLGWMDVRERFIYFQTLLMFKCIHGQAPDYLTNNVILDLEVRKVSSRQHGLNLFVPFPDNDFYKNLLFYRGPRDWNNLPNYLKDITNIDLFKKTLKRFIKSSRIE